MASLKVELHNFYCHDQIGVDVIDLGVMMYGSLRQFEKKISHFSASNGCDGFVVLLEETIL